MKKKVVGLFAAALLFVPCLLACAGCSWLKGGKDKVLIDSAKEFVNKVIDSNKLTEEIGANGRRKTQYTYLLTKDLDFSGIDYVPIDTFYDILDGDGHTIKNLTIQAGYDKAGLFQTLEVRRFADYTVLSGTVKNLKFENVTIKGNDYVGAVAGYIGRHISEYAFPVLENIEVVSGSIEGKDYVGGLVGAAGDNYILLNDCKNLVNRANVTQRAALRTAALTELQRPLIRSDSERRLWCKPKIARSLQVKPTFAAFTAQFVQIKARAEFSQ